MIAPGEKLAFPHRTDPNDVGAGSPRPAAGTGNFASPNAKTGGVPVSRK